MALQDIMPYRATGAGEERLAGPIAAAEAFMEGEPLVFDGAGALTECGDDPAAVDGVAAMRALDVDQAAIAAGSVITYYGVPDDQVFACDNFATAGAGAAVVPTAANAIGQLAGLSRPGDIWSVDTGAANGIVRIVNVLDVNGCSASQTPGRHQVPVPGYCSSSSRRRHEKATSDDCLARVDTWVGVGGVNQESTAGLPSRRC